MGSPRLLRFLAVVLTALALVPAGAHLFELPNKIGLPRDAYFAAQGLYRGWALFGFVWFGALAANLGLAAALRRRRARAAARLALAAGLLVALSLAVFFAWTYPANLDTENWTRAPPDWEALRRRWEYSHAANAGLLFLAFCSVVLSAVLDDGGWSVRASGQTPTEPPRALGVPRLDPPPLGAAAGQTKTAPSATSGVSLAVISSENAKPATTSDRGAAPVSRARVQ